MLSKYWLGLVMVMLPTFCFAYPGHAQLDKITYAIRGEQWVRTNAAKLQVQVDASLTDETIGTLRDKAEQNLKRIAPGDWHITELNRRQDSSGLERVELKAEARIQQKHLAMVRQHARQLSKPGITYRIIDIAYKPSEAEFDAARTLLRQRLLNQVKQQLTELNQLFPQQHYTLHRVNFIPEQTRQLSARRSGKMSSLMSATPQSMVTVGNCLRQQAVVILAANRLVQQDRE